MRCNAMRNGDREERIAVVRLAPRHFDFAFDARLERDRLQRGKPRRILRLQRDVQCPARLDVARLEHRPERTHRCVGVGHHDADLREQCDQCVARFHREFERHRNVFVGVVVRRDQAIDGEAGFRDHCFGRNQLRVVRSRRFGDDGAGALR